MEHRRLNPTNEWSTLPLLSKPKKIARSALAVYAPVGRARGRDVPAHPFYVHYQCRTRRGCDYPGENTGHNYLRRSYGILCRYFYFAMSLLLATIVFTGFKRTVNENLFHPAVPRPFILWIHASAFTAWTIFFICQSALVRVRKVSWHRTVGWFGAGLAALMAPLGVATAIVMARFDTVQLHQAGADAFLSIPFYDMIAFGVCTALAICWRTKPELHRRLIFIASCGLMDAAFGRFL